MESLPRAQPALRLLTYNIQSGIASPALRSYITGSWQYFLPSKKRSTNLDNIARLLRHYDIVALQEVDAGSLRTRFVNQVEYLARQAKFAHWHFQLNRILGRFAQHSNGILSRLSIHEIEYHSLPGRITGRGAMVVKLKYHNHFLVIINVHLALGKNSRQKQLDYLAEIVKQYSTVIILGDMNCTPHHPVIQHTFTDLGLRCATQDIKTYPSWHPWRALDQIWVTANLKVRKPQTKHYLYSDHLPISVDVHFT